jgi:hypothetical protein
LKKIKTALALLLVGGALTGYAETFGDILLTDTFDARPAGALATSGGWSDVNPGNLATKRRLEVMGDTNNVMGDGTGNQILFFQNIAAKPDQYVTWLAADGLPSASALKVSFDFYEPSTTTGGLTVYAGTDPYAANPVNAFRLVDGFVEPAGGYTLDAPHHLDVIFNETGAALEYDDPASAISTLDSGLMDIWIDGVQAADGVSFLRDSSPSLSITSLFLTSGSTNQEIYLDNITISQSGTAPPPPPPPTALLITNLTVSTEAVKVEWNKIADRFIVVGAAGLDGLLSNGLCVASATAATTNSISFPYNADSGFFRVLLNIAAVDGISSPELVDAIKEQSTAALPTNRIYDVETAAIVGLTLPGQSFSVDELVSVTNLQALSLADSGLTAIGDLSFLEDLVWLNLSSNLLTDLSGLGALTSLEALDLQHNLISDLSGIESLIHLRWLDLEYNQITDLAPVVTNAASGGLGNGDELWLRGNPLSAVATNQIHTLETNYNVRVVY